MDTGIIRFAWERAVVRLAPASRLLAGLRGRLKHVLLAGRRENLTANLRAAFPAKTAGEIRKICRRVFVTTERDGAAQRRLELLSEAQLRHELAGVRLRGQEHLEGAYAGGRAVILVTPHYGSFMLGALRVAADYAKNGVYFFYNPPEKNAYAGTSNRLLDRPERGCHKIYNNSQGIKTALKVLRAQGTLCMMPDLIAVTTSTLYVPFFGRFFAAMAGTAFLALRTNAAVIPAYCHAVRGTGPVLEFRPAIEAAAAPGKTADDRIYELTARLFQELERQIALRPEPWRYWHVYLKRSIPFPTPPPGPAELLTQLQGCDPVVAQDQHLAGIIRQWRAVLEAGSRDEA